MSRTSSEIRERRSILINPVLNIPKNECDSEYKTVNEPDSSGLH